VYLEQVNGKAEHCMPTTISLDISLIRILAGLEVSFREVLWTANGAKLAGCTLDSRAKVGILPRLALLNG
jgi:hypothetical protein